MAYYTASFTRLFPTTALTSISPPNDLFEEHRSLIHDQIEELRRSLFPKLNQSRIDALIRTLLVRTDHCAARCLSLFLKWPQPSISVDVRDACDLCLCQRARMGP